MNWFRKHIEQGSRLALLALAVQLVLSFGHVHVDVARAAPGPVVAQVALPGADHAPAHSHSPADFCAICAVMAMTGTALVSAPPVLLLPQATDLLRAITTAEFLHLGHANAPFQPRGPPAT